jgi:hypothetical protein
MQQKRPREEAVNLTGDGAAAMPQKRPGEEAVDLSGEGTEGRAVGAHKALDGVFAIRRDGKRGELVWDMVAKNVETRFSEVLAPTLAARTTFSVRDLEMLCSTWQNAGSPKGMVARAQYACCQYLSQQDDVFGTARALALLATTTKSRFAFAKSDYNGVAFPAYEAWLKYVLEHADELQAKPLEWEFHKAWFAGHFVWFRDVAPMRTSGAWTAIRETFNRKIHYRAANLPAALAMKRGYVDRFDAKILSSNLFL